MSTEKEKWPLKKSSLWHRILCFFGFHPAGGEQTKTQDPEVSGVFVVVEIRCVECGILLYNKTRAATLSEVSTRRNHDRHM